MWEQQSALRFHYLTLWIDCSNYQCSGRNVTRRGHSISLSASPFWSSVLKGIENKCGESVFLHNVLGSCLILCVAICFHSVVSAVVKTLRHPFKNKQTNIYTYTIYIYRVYIKYKYTVNWEIQYIKYKYKNTLLCRKLIYKFFYCFTFTVLNVFKHNNNIYIFLIRSL